MAAADLGPDTEEELPIGDLHTETWTSDVRAAAAGLRPRVPGLVILCHPDAERVGEVAALPELAAGESVELSRLAPSFAPPDRGGRFRPLGVAHLSRQPLRLAGAPDGGVTVERAGSRTRLSVRGEEIASHRTVAAAELERGVTLVLSRRVTLLLCRVDPIPIAAPSFGLVGDAEATVRLRQEIRTAAELDVPVLLRGETGTGKELVARAIHDAGRRRREPYVAVNVGALVPSIAASELFGAARGAYTGADRGKAGFFESADGGTLFLDEIGEAPAEVQVMLLRTLESHEVQPVGSVDSRAVDVRVLAATDADLETAIAAGTFRRSLLHRLAGYEIRVPPLRARRDDVARLLYHFLRAELGDLPAADESPWPPADLVARLVEHDWPGNVRELRNAARRLATARRTGRPETLVPLVTELLEDTAAVPAPHTPPAAAGPPPRRGFRKPSEVSEDELLTALATHRWQPRPAAAALGVSRATLYRLIEGCARIRKAVEVEAGEIAAALARAGGDVEAAAAELQVSPQGLKRRITDLGLTPAP